MRAIGPAPGHRPLRLRVVGMKIVNWLATANPWVWWVLAGGFLVSYVIAFVADLIGLV